MPRRPFRFLFLLLGACVALIATNRYILHDALGNAALAVVGRPAAYAFNRLAFARALASQAIHWRSLARDNERLAAENAALRSQAARAQALKEENDFLRASAGAVKKAGGRAVPGSIFHLETGPLGMTALVNRGTDAGVADGAIVISEGGALAGRVIERFPAFSRIRLVTDPRFEVTAAVTGARTKGIARGAGDRGLILDFIVQGDIVSEGDMVVTSGDDLYPAGLVLGTIAHIAVDETAVFKDVRIAPAYAIRNLGRVMLISP